MKSHIFEKLFENIYVPYCTTCHIKFLGFYSLGNF